MAQTKLVDEHEHSSLSWIEWIDAQIRTSGRTEAPTPVRQPVQPVFAPPRTQPLPPPLAGTLAPTMVKLAPPTVLPRPLPSPRPLGAPTVAPFAPPRPTAYDTRVWSPWPPPTTPPQPAPGPLGSLGATQHPDIAAAEAKVRSRRVGLGMVGLVVGIGGVVAVQSETPSAKIDLATAATRTQQATTIGFETRLDSAGTSRTLRGAVDLLQELTRFDATPVGTPILKASPAAAYLDVRHDVLYVDSDAGMAQQTAWARLNLDGAERSPQAVIDVYANGMNHDPLAPLRLASTAMNQRRAGVSTIFNRIRAREYEFEVGMADALQSVGTSIDVVTEGSKTALPATVTYHVWIDDDNYVRQMEFEVPGQDKVLHYVARYTDIDPVAAVTVPVELDEMLGN